MNNRAHWIWSSEATHEKPTAPPASHYDVRLFRRTFRCADVRKARLVAEVSADSRYILWLNGNLVGRGPAKGDIHHHFLDRVDATAHLKNGMNALTALVLDMSTVAHRPSALGAPCSIMTYAGGFLLAGGLRDSSDALIEDLSTGSTWRVFVDTAHRFQSEGTRFEGYHGYFEHRVSSEEPSGWRNAGFDDSSWSEATVLYPAELATERRDPASPYGLVPRIIPMLEEGPERPFAEVFSPSDACARDDAAGESANVRTHSFPIPVSPRSRMDILVDAGEMTTGFPVLRISGGKGSRIRLTYAEALRLPWDTPGARMLGRRQSLANLASHFADESTGWTFDRHGTIAGWSDVWEPSGDRGEEVFEPLHWRAFRFIGLAITTGDDALTLHSAAHRFCAYPYSTHGTFRCSDPELNRIWDISLRTMRLCSHETFEDCVHYEQMQYAGDTMITSKIAMLTTGDYRLSRQALLHFDWSRIPEGLTQSRYPSRLLQVIPSWSLHWITNIRDYLLLSGDAGTCRQLLPGVSAVLDWFRRHGDDDGLPARLPFWNTADWCPTWQRGQPPGWDSGPTCVIAGQYIVALAEAAELNRLLGYEETALALDAEATGLRPILHGRFWSEREGLYHDRPGGPELSQYGNAWAILAGAADDSTCARILRRFPSDPALATVSFFGWHAIFSALVRCRAYDTMPLHLNPWREMMANGLTTWAEENTYWRSLCHAWTAHPAIEFATRVLGVRPVSPGFAHTVIEPHACGLDHASGAVCTPHGLIHVSWNRRGEDLEIEVTAPEKLMFTVIHSDGSTEDRPGGHFISRREGVKA